MTSQAADIIIVAGSGRSGTTWLGNVIAGDDRRIIFEPFECRRVAEFAELGMRPYFSPAEAQPQWHSKVEALFSGRIGNEWTDQDRKRLDPERDTGGVVIKEIRANGMLAWLSNNFPCRIVYLVRHPYAVIASRVKQQWDSHIEAYLCQPRLVQDFLEPYLPVIESAQGNVQKHAVMWCLENLVPLRQMSQYPWLFCRYEELAAHPEREADHLLSRLGLEFTPGRMQALAELSRTCSRKPTDRSTEALTDPRHALPEDERREVARIINAFGIDLYQEQL
ncbi:sulfotransferase domain-containing protein [Geomonas subterranea]|uniref:Sulfotransferase n=1 Tax=Geomonas subterranea TaxID=2847989 RepID=A0ABX8LHH8_9BACT|nr:MULTISPECIES: sulfotransferase domain-containing protein [Geomonas]QXE90919.1 sulfotransferase [Geomonas subterranea]QXM10995.1 sulfotransferase [Geomonas subterranea]